MSGVTYDTGALIAAEAGRPDLWGLHKRVLQRGIRPMVPAGVLAQAWRGGPQVQLSRLLRGCQIEPLGETRARLAGRACAVAGSSDIVDASVVVGALVRRDLVVTSDGGDLERLASALGEKLWLHRV